MEKAKRGAVRGGAVVVDHRPCFAGLLRRVFEMRSIGVEEAVHFSWSGLGF